LTLIYSYIEIRSVQEQFIIKNLERKYRKIPLDLVFYLIDPTYISGEGSSYDAAILKISQPYMGLVSLAYNP
jgi:hypothetical protein